MTQVAFWFFLAGLSIWPIIRLVKGPYRCNGCGFTSWSPEKMMDHSEAKHTRKKGK